MRRRVRRLRRRLIRWLAWRCLKTQPLLAVEYLRQEKPYYFGVPPGLTVTSQGGVLTAIQGVPTRPGSYLFTLDGQLHVSEVGGNP